MLRQIRCFRFLISIHAPAKGATLFRLLFHTHSRDFNPRSREGSDENDY